MGQPNAKKGDRVVGQDVHIELTSVGIPIPVATSFSGTLEHGLSSTVFVGDQPAAIVGSSADNSPAHIPSFGQFQRPPGNSGTVASGSSTVFASDVAVARDGDPVDCCNDVEATNNGHIIASGTVSSG